MRWNIGLCLGTDNPKVQSAHKDAGHIIWTDSCCNDFWLCFLEFHASQNMNTSRHGFRLEKGEKLIFSSTISQATGRCSSWSLVQYTTRDYWELIWVYSKKYTICITGNWWPNYVLVKKCLSFTNVSIILSIPSILIVELYICSPSMSSWIEREQLYVLLLKFIFFSCETSSVNMRDKY